MSKKGIQRRRLPGDGVVTLKDFADAKTVGGKTKKAVTSRTIDQAVAAADDIEFDEEISTRNRQRRKKTTEVEDPNHIYNDLHLDIWFLISEHIRPEDVGRFGLICRKTDLVVSSARFWFSMYRRYYRRLDHLPARFSPDCMVRLGGLRSHVIRCLFYTYPPYVQRLKYSPDLSTLNGLKFVNCWFKEESKVWIFCYKLSNRTKVRDPKPVQTLDEDDDEFEKSLAQFNNIYDNPHEGSSLLVICTERFIPFPIMAGEEMHLQSARQTLCQDMRSSTLELEFSSPRERRCVVTVAYPKILKFKIINWWHPDYSIFVSTHS